MSSSSDGTGDIWVDDQLLVTVDRPDGTSESRSIDFSFGCQGHVSTAAAEDLSALFAVGKNTVHVELADICGGHVGCTALYLAIEHGAVLGPTTLQGIDVNATQGASIDWPAVLAAGYRFVLVKATSGDADEPALRNIHLEQQVAGARSAKLAVGVYHYAYAGTGNRAADEAQYFLDIAGKYVREGYLRPALDVEDDPKLPASQRNSSLGAEALTAWVDEWMDTVKSQTGGVEPLLYVSSSYAQDHLLPSIGKYDVWIADWGNCNTEYPPDTSPDLNGIWDDWAFWQYWAPKTEGDGGCSGSRRVPGIADPVDLDVLEGGTTQLDEYVIPPGEGWKPPSELLVGSSRFCIEQGVFDYCTRLDWGYSSQWLQNGATNEILLADARKEGSLESIGIVQFDRIEIRLRAWACYSNAWAKLFADDIELVTGSAGQVISLDDMEGSVLDRWTKWEYRENSTSGGTGRGGELRAVVSPADGSQALQVFVPTGVDPSCAGVWAVRAYDMPTTLNTSTAMLRIFLRGEGQGDYHEGFMEILLYRRP